VVRDVRGRKSVRAAILNQNYGETVEIIKARVSIKAKAFRRGSVMKRKRLEGRGKGGGGDGSGVGL
jgi:hypothetical protein